MTMKSSIVLVLLTVLIIASFPTWTEAQVSEREMDRKMQKQVEELERRKSLLTSQEQRLDSGLYELMLLAEQADTSAEKARELRFQVRASESLDADSTDRVRIAVYLPSTAFSAEVVDNVKAHDGEIIFGGNSSCILCRIHPKWFRQLLRLQSIDRISTQSEGHTR
jgi:hypothetical protein